MARYLNEFFSLRSAGDILNACGPINNGDKEISEAMAFKTILKSLLIEKPMYYSVIDFCSGNALIPVISSFVLPSKRNIAIDKKRRNRKWHEIRRFSYLEENINDTERMLQIVKEQGPCILTACHACKNLAKKIINIYINSPAAINLILMPCCIGTIPKDYKSLESNRYEIWNSYLLELSGGYIITDKNVLSPRNKIIIASRKEKNNEKLK